MKTKKFKDDEFLLYLYTFDLNNYEARVYETLLKLGETTAWQIALQSNVPQAKIYEVLSSLESKGFVERAVGRPLKFRPIEPEISLPQVIEKFKNEYSKKLEMMEKAFKEIKDKYSTRKNESLSFIWTIKGRERVFAKAKEMIDSAKKEVLIAGHRPLRALNCMDTLGALALNKNVKIRVLGNFSQDCIDFMEMAGIEYRIIESFYEYMIIVDERELLLAIAQPDGELYGIDVSAKECIMANKDHFEFLWGNKTNCK
ncbi:MAG: TrmB family transcriptional regulator [Thermoplasmata archaeon]|jgi:sugar-specific transcriptional regulator TrmB|nr:TrmB family transcriptional regulator [Euryarchaeota archaeon]